jgi:hypothetical protein
VTVFARSHAPAKPKVFLVGLHRTGTQSAHHLFERAGFAGVHWPAVHRGVDYQAMAAGHERDLDYIADTLAPVIASEDALSDVPIGALYECLAARYPEARFIALVRPAADWVRSIRKHTGARPLDPYEKVLFWRYLPGKPESLAGVSDEALHAMHASHHAGLQAFFAGNPRFRMFDLYDPFVGESICDFMGLPRQPLGHVDDVEGRPASLRRGLRFARAALQHIVKILVAG